MATNSDNSNQQRAHSHLAAVASAAMPSVEHVRAQHLSLIIEIAHLHAHQAKVTVAPNSAMRAKSRRRRTFAVSFAVCMLAIPGLALAGALPDGLQTAVSSAANKVGVHIPKPKTHVTKSDDNADRADNHGDTVSGIATDRSGTPEKTHGPKNDADGPRNHGDRVSSVAKSNNHKSTKSNNGNHYGQVTAGPDNGQAGESHGGDKPAHGDKPDHSGAGNGHTTPQSPQPAPQASPPPTPNAGGNGNGNH
jgi:hypothetical protein